MIPGIIAGGMRTIITDPYFGDVTLLMHMDGVDGSSSFIDETGKIFSATGDTEISTTLSVFGGASGRFFGAGGLVRSVSDDSAFALGELDFTIEFRLYKTRNNVSESFVAVGPNSTNGFGIIGYSSNSDKIGVVLAGTGEFVLVDPDVTPINQWIYVSLTRSSGTFRLFVNGVLKASVSRSLTFNAGACCIGAWVDFSNFKLLGNIDELRITKGVARYTTNFTPPTAPFPNS